MKVRVVEYVRWRYPNRAGAMARFCKSFRDRGVDLQGLWACSSLRGGLAAASRNPVGLRAALRGLGIRFKKGRCFYATGHDRRGALIGLLEKLAEARISVQDAETLPAGRSFTFCFCVRDKDFVRTKRLLKAK